jgi:hypothetical protein
MVLSHKRRVAVAAFSCLVALILASPAFATTVYYGGNHAYQYGYSVSYGTAHVLTDDFAENGSCYGNGTDCGVTLGAFATLPSNGNLWGPEYYGTDYASHVFSNTNLYAGFQEFTSNGAWIYGGLDY